MTRKTLASDSAPVAVKRGLTTLGDNIRIARKRRSLTMDQMAERMLVTRKTLGRLERGEPGVSLSVLASALWVLGLEQTLLEVAAPEKDDVGAFRDLQKLPKRVRNTADDDLDF